MSPLLFERTGSYLLAMLRALVFCLCASGLVAALLIASPSPNTPGELGLVLFWTVPFAIGLALASPAAMALFSRFPRFFSYGLAMVLGVVAGFLWGSCVFSVFINPYLFGTFSIPIGFVWGVGGISGLVAIAGIGSRAKRGNLLIEIAVVGAICLAVGLGSDSFVIWLLGEREVDMVWIKWRPGSEALVLDSRLQNYLTEDEQARLLAMNLGGRLEWQRTALRGRGPSSRMVIVMQHQLDEPVELPLPAERGVIYIQEQEGWRMDPSDAPTVRKTLRLEIDPGFPNTTLAVLKEPGGTSGFTAMSWGGPPPP